jgi:hypothetical protein
MMPRPKAKRTFENLRFAIEIEVEFPSKKDSQKLISKHRIIRGWALDYDGSLDNGAEYRPKDRNKLYWNEDSIDQIKEIVGLIKAHKGHIKGSTCGFHVHVDMTKFSNKEICNIIKAYIKQQTKIYKQFNVLKCRLDYAQKIPTTVLKHLTEANIKKVRENDTCYGEGNDYFNERHYGCNVLALQKHGTLEFRMINGTIQISRIKAYIKWCLEFCLKYAKGGK